MPTIKLQSSDGIIFEVEEDVAKLSLTIRRLMEDLGLDEDGVGGEVLPLPTVKACTLEKVIAWATEHRNDAPPPAGDEEDWPPPIGMDGPECVEPSPFDLEFLDVDQETLYQVLMAAKELQIKGLLNLVCKTVADMIRGKTTEEIRQLFGIVNDFSPEEEEQVRHENEWSNSCNTPAHWSACNRHRERQFRDPHAVSFRGRRRAAARRLEGGPEWFQ